MLIHMKEIPHLYGCTHCQTVFFFSREKKKCPWKPFLLVFWIFSRAESVFHAHFFLFFSRTLFFSRALFLYFFTGRIFRFTGRIFFFFFHGLVFFSLAQVLLSIFIKIVTIINTWSWNWMYWYISQTQLWFFSRTLFRLSRAHFFQIFTGKKFSFTDTNSQNFHGHFCFFTGTFVDFFHGWNSDFHGEKNNTGVA